MNNAKPTPSPEMMAAMLAADTTVGPAPCPPDRGDLWRRISFVEVSCTPPREEVRPLPPCPNT